MVYLDETSFDFVSRTKHPVYTDDNVGRGMASLRMTEDGVEKVWRPISRIGFMTKADFLQTYPSDDIAGPDSVLARLVAEHSGECEHWSGSIGTEAEAKAVRGLIEDFIVPSTRRASAMFGACSKFIVRETERMLKETLPPSENWEERYRAFLFLDEENQRIENGETTC